MSLAPSLGLAAWLGERAERSVVVFATLLGIAMAGWNGIRSRNARSVWPLGLALTALWSGSLWPELHHMPWLHAATMAFGGSMMAWAHWRHLR